MSAVRVLGIGSPFGADRIGWDLAAALKERLNDRHAPGLVAIETCDRPGAALLEKLHGAGAAILIDAMQAGLAPGTLQRLTPDQLEEGNGLPSSHGLGVADALALGEALGSLPPRLILFGVEIGGLEMPVLQPALEALLIPLEEAVQREIEACLERDRNAASG